MSSLTGVIIEEMSSPFYYCHLIVEKMKTIKLTEILHANYDIYITQVATRQWL